MTENSEAWNATDIPALEAAVNELGRREQAAFALLCAERLAATDAEPRRSLLREWIAVGWGVFESQSGDCGSEIAELEARDDLDEDPVAAVAYALESVDGKGENAWWVSNRALTAAIELLYSSKDSTFHPLAEDLAAPNVERELDWQFTCVRALRSRGSHSAVIDSIRQMG